MNNRPEILQNESKRQRIYLFTMQKNKKNNNTVNACRKDRRSGQDRRKSCDPHYFERCGLERRSWKERRYYWYMTM